MEDELNYPLVSIIIINWNGHEDTIECLESIYQTNYPNYNVILVDNGSNDISLEIIKDYCRGKIKVNSKYFQYDSSNKPIRLKEFKKKELKTRKKEKLAKKNSLILIKNDENYGFAKGNNIGIRYALNNFKSEYILLLNNDTVVDKNFLSNLVNIDDKTQEIAAIQSTIYYYDNKDKIQSIGGKFNLFTGSGPSIINSEKDFIECDVLNGAAMLIKSSAFDKVGLIDDQYFLYMEETDWCFRARKNNFSLRGCKKSKVWHKIYSSSGGEINPVLLYYWNRNILLFYKKHNKKYLPTFFPFYIFRLIVQIGKFSFKSDFKCVKAIFYGFIDGIIGKQGKLKRSIY